jgi:cytochrome P450
MVMFPFDPFDQDYLSNPYPLLADLTEHQPVFFDEALGYWVVSRHATVERVMKDLQAFSADIAQDPLTPICPHAKEALVGFAPSKVLSNSEPETHSRIRPALNTAFARRVVLQEPAIRSHATELIAALADSIERSGEADLVATVCFPLPAATIFALIGFPEIDTDQLKAWCSDRLSFSWGRPTEEAQVRIAKQMVEYWNYCTQFTHSCASSTHTDHFTGDLVAIHHGDNAVLSLQEITSVIYGLSFAGHETTTNLISNTVRQVLLSGVYKQLVEDPSKIPAAVEEAIRIDSSVIAWRRRTRHAVTLDGVDIPADSRILLMLSAANHDPAMFPDPTRFDLSRVNVKRHLSFGKGAHFCLVAQLARVQVQIVLEALTTQLPNLAMTNQAFTFHPNVSFRGPTVLSLTASPSGLMSGS